MDPGVTAEKHPRHAPTPSQSAQRGSASGPECGCAMQQRSSMRTRARVLRCKKNCVRTQARLLRHTASLRLVPWLPTVLRCDKALRHNPSQTAHMEHMTNHDPSQTYQIQPNVPSRAQLDCSHAIGGSHIHAIRVAAAPKPGLSDTTRGGITSPAKLPRCNGKVASVWKPGLHQDPRQQSISLKQGGASRRDYSEATGTCVKTRARLLRCQGGLLRCQGVLLRCSGGINLTAQMPSLARAVHR